MPTHPPDFQPTVFLKTTSLRQGPRTFRITKGHLFGPQGAEIADLSQSTWLTPAFEITSEENHETFLAPQEEQAPEAKTGIRTLNAEIHTEPTRHGGAEHVCGFRVLVEGTCDRTLACVRCLCQFQQTIVFSDRIFAPDSAKARPDPEKELKSASKKTLDEEVQLEAQDLDVYEFSSQGLAIDELLLDLIEGATPDYPVCTESCLGLCPECGKSLNQGSCGGDRENCPILQTGGLH